MILGDVFLRNERYFGNETAVEFEGRSLTHADFARRIRKLINALIGRGCKHADRIAVLSRNSMEYLEVYGAAALAGFATVGINYRLSAPEQTEIVLDSEPRLLIFEAVYADRVADLRERLPDNILYVAVGAAPDWAIDYDALIAEGADSPASVRASEDDTLMLIYTSGTTGKPKGVMLGNQAMVEMAREQALVYSAKQNDRIVIVMPFYHIGGTAPIFTYLLMGGSIILHRTFDPVEVLERIAQSRPTTAHLAPTMIQMILDAMDGETYDVSSIQTICYASAPMSVPLLRRAHAVFGPIFMQIYGLTEAALGSVLLKHQHVLDGTPKQEKRLASAGQPYLTTRMRIVRSDGTDCDVGEVGEILIKSPTVMQGYWRKPDETAAAMKDGEIRTGDVGYWDESQFLYIVDRKKDMIVSGGENIYSREVEDALLSHPAVAEVAVIGVPDKRWGESVMAFVVLREGHSLSEDEAAEHCRQLIASYKKPRFLKVVRSIPRVSSTNKVDKKALREPYWNTQDRQIA